MPDTLARRPAIAPQTGSVLRRPDPTGSCPDPRPDPRADRWAILAPQGPLPRQVARTRYALPETPHPRPRLLPTRRRAPTETAAHRESAAPRSPSVRHGQLRARVARAARCPSP